MVEAWVLQLLAALAAVIGLGWLALAMDTHWAQAHGSPAPSAGAPRALRLLGAAALAIAFGLCLAADHATMAVLVWFMLVAGAAVAVAMTLSWRPHWLRRLWPLAAAR